MSWKKKHSERSERELIRAGLVEGRIRENGMPQSLIPPFAKAVELATQEELVWALTLLIKNRNALRTYREKRMATIANKLMEKIK